MVFIVGGRRGAFSFGTTCGCNSSNEIYTMALNRHTVCLAGWLRGFRYGYLNSAVLPLCSSFMQLLPATTEIENKSIGKTVS